MNGPCECMNGVLFLNRLTRRQIRRSGDMCEYLKGLIATMTGLRPRSDLGNLDDVILKVSTCIFSPTLAVHQVTAPRFRLVTCRGNVSLPRVTALGGDLF